MKYAFLFSIAIIFFTSCDSSAQQQENTDKTPNADTPVSKTDTKEAKPAFVDIDVVQFKKRMEQPDVVVIDVRTPEETAEGKIEGAIEIDVYDPLFDEKIQALEKDKIYLVYCAAGVRSAKSCKKMAKMGFENLYNLKGGYGAWSEAQE